ncbi:MAG: hypothetical protein V7K32_01920 [Nostoc sp.]
MNPIALGKKNFRMSDRFLLRRLTHKKRKIVHAKRLTAGYYTETENTEE